MKVSRIVCALAAVLVSINLSLATENQAKDKDPKVLLVYSSGEPYKKMNEIKSPEELEAITAPTPVLPLAWLRSLITQAYLTLFSPAGPI